MNNHEIEQLTLERDAAFKCIEEIQHARNVRKPSYVVDDILKEWQKYLQEREVEGVYFDGR